MVYMKKIMIVEDDKRLAEELKNFLVNNTYEALVVEDFTNVVAEIIKKEADLVLLDINLPHINGSLVLKELRKKSNVPVIMVTSSTSELDEAITLSNGADDYVTKPYNPTLLLLRIQNIFKRIESTNTKLTYGEIEVVPSKGILLQKDNQLVLTKNEMIIFMYLLSKRGNIVSRDELMDELWNNSEYINDNALTVNISRLRNKLESLGLYQSIETRKGQGYILK